MKIAPARPAIVPPTLPKATVTPVVVQPQVPGTAINPFARPEWLKAAKLPSPTADITASMIYTPIISASGDLPPLQIAALGVKLFDKARQGDWVGVASAGTKVVASGYKWAASNGMLGTAGWVAVVGAGFSITAQIAGEAEKYAKDKKSG